MIDLTPLLNAVIAIIAAMAMRYIIPCIKNKTTAQDREEMLVWVDIAVAAAQQLYHQSSGADRLEYALSLLEEKGYNVNDSAVRDAVEAAVLRLHQSLMDGESA